ncbi:hypothetical protein SDRG_05250 [Saprolegnia diclina VS20]|uniref:ERCC4 domain-containing protein n=1 Tax=Saprolegnia diclina (strain VS20) TaxID=1156394 RepID=T0S4K7_SAPDV|nr:hypothetical protein SDRG_05250 [Saprolegnia diclina VS20]EQC37662.1 hypothetical protein SDRG_05250 [Saprolegnia diclina VS20]|eukprot:XP_008609182.1 hypothetical protein SDRG_05250 [Saprolegnia diclina VS20]
MMMDDSFASDDDDMHGILSAIGLGTTAKRPLPPPTAPDLPLARSTASTGKRTATTDAIVDLSESPVVPKRPRPARVAADLPVLGGPCLRDKPTPVISEPRLAATNSLHTRATSPVQAANYTAAVVASPQRAVVSSMRAPAFPHASPPSALNEAVIDIMSDSSDSDDALDVPLRDRLLAQRRPAPPQPVDEADTNGLDASIISINTNTDDEDAPCVPAPPPVSPHRAGLSSPVDVVALEDDDGGDEYAVMLASPRSAPPSQQVTSPVYDLVDSDDDNLLPPSYMTSSQRSTASVQDMINVDASEDEYAYAYMDHNPYALTYSPPSSPLFSSALFDRPIPRYTPPRAACPPPVAAPPTSAHLGPTEPQAPPAARAHKAKAKAKATKSPAKPRKPKPQVHVYLEESLFDADVGEKMYTALVNHTTASKPTPFGCYVTDASTVSHVVPKSIMWRDASTMVPMACVYLSAADFIHAIATEYASVYDHIVKLRQQVSDPYARTFFLVEGLEKALVVHQRARQRQGHGMRPMTFADVHNAVVHLFVNSFCHIHFAATPDDSAAYVLSLTREIAALPSTPPNDFLSHVPRLTSVRATTNGDTSNELANAWLRMLEMIPGMSPEMAQRLLDYYPTIDSLMTVYVNPNVPVKVKELLLADKLVATRASKVLSKRIFAIFTSPNPRAIAL